MPDPFRPDDLLGRLAVLPTPRRYWVAYSGGMDSHVLVHALAGKRRELAPAAVCAVHVDHGLRPESGKWSQHCMRVCLDLGVPLRLVRVQAAAARGESPEAAARAARYRALADLLRPDDCLLTAHHQDDQAETVLLQMLRGGGPRGLAAMPQRIPFGRGALARPLLGYPRAALQAYAEMHALTWVDDPSNFDVGFDRNLLRHRVFPELHRRWPAAARTLARTASHCAESVELLDHLAAQDLSRAQGERPDTLSVARTLALGPARQRNLLRHFVTRVGLPMPSAVQLEHIRQDALLASRDANPCIEWPGGQVRRYRDLLYAGRRPAEHDPTLVLPWCVQRPLPLPRLGRRLNAVPDPAGGIKGALAGRRDVTVRFRRGGERCRPVGRGQTHTLKHLMQEAGIPPWERERLPLIYVGEELAAVAGLCVCEPYAAKPGEGGLRITWEPDHGCNDPGHSIEVDLLS
jgi:tRNA(Ile)-lysidine synthase